MDSMIATLLNKASAIVEELKVIKTNSDETFNIFNITGFATDEVKVCRMLAEILSPDGKHKRGVFFLDSFINNVLGLDLEAQELNEAWVYTECHTDQERRIDIVIETTKRFIPIGLK